MVGPRGGPFGACVNSPAFFWVLGFMPLSFWMVPSRSRSPSFLPLPSPLSLSPTNAPAAVSSVALLCLATGFTAFGYAAALLFLSHPSVFPRLSVWPPSLPPFFPAVGLRIKIRHFIVSKFCEADNIAAPIAAAERRGRARAGTLRCWFCYRINRLSDRFRATNKANEPPSLFNRLRATRPVARLLLRRRPLYMGNRRMGPPLPFAGRSECDCSYAHWIIIGPDKAKWPLM